MRMDFCAKEKITQLTFPTYTDLASISTFSSIVLCTLVPAPIIGINNSYYSDIYKYNFDYNYQLISDNRNRMIITDIIPIKIH